MAAQQLFQALDYRDYKLALLKAAHQLEWKLKQEREAEAKRVLSAAAAEALQAVAQVRMSEHS